MSNEDYERREAVKRQLENIPGLREKLGLGKKPQEANGGAEAYTMPSSVEAPSAVESPPARPPRPSASDTEELSAKFQWPDRMAPEAFYGPAGEMVKLIEPHSEADPAAYYALPCGLWFTRRAAQMPNP